MVITEQQLSQESLVNLHSCDPAEGLEELERAISWREKKINEFRWQKGRLNESLKSFEIAGLADVEAANTSNEIKETVDGINELIDQLVSDISLLKSGQEILRRRLKMQ